MHGLKHTLEITITVVVPGGGRRKFSRYVFTFPGHLGLLSPGEGWVCYGQFDPLSF